MVLKRFIAVFIIPVFESVLCILIKKGVMPVEALAIFPSLYEITEWGKGARPICMDKKRKDKSGSGLFFLISVIAFRIFQKGFFLPFSRKRVLSENFTMSLKEKIKRKNQKQENGKQKVYKTTSPGGY